MSLDHFPPSSTYNPLTMFIHNFGTRLEEGNQVDLPFGSFFAYTSYFQPESLPHSSQRPLKAIVLVADIPHHIEPPTAQQAWVTGVGYPVPTSYIPAEDDFDIMILTTNSLVVPIQHLLIDPETGEPLLTTFAITGKCAHTEYWGERCLIVEVYDGEGSWSIAYVTVLGTQTDSHPNTWL